MIYLKTQNNNTEYYTYTNLLDNISCFKLFDQISENEYVNGTQFLSPFYQIEKTKDLFATFYILYNKYYLYNIYQLIHKKDVKYFWLNIAEIKQYLYVRPNRDIDWNSSQYVNKNLYLQQNDKNSLLNDMIEHGIFFPFLVSGQEKKINNCFTNELLLGFHRAYSIIHSSDNFNTLSNKFLFLDLSNLNDNNKNEITFYYCIDGILNSSNYLGIFKQSITQSKILENYLFSFQECLGNKFIYFPRIMPNPILNNPQLFNNFINQKESELFYE